MTQQNVTKKSQVDEDEIDLIQLAKTLWKGRKTVIEFTLIFMAIGLFVAIFTPKVYTASTTFVPQTKDSKIGGNLGGLAAMAGINLGSMGGDSGISPELYPQIIYSIPFQKELLQTPLTIEGHVKEVTYTDYYTNIHSPGLLSYIKKYTIGLPGLLISAIKGKPTNVSLSTVEGANQLLSITNDENELIKLLSSQLVLDVNKKDGYVTILAYMPEAIASAQLVEKAQNLLQQYIIDFKIQKSAEKLIFVEKRYNEKEIAFKKAQSELAIFQDSNQFVNSELAKIKLMRLQSDYDLAYNVFNELAKQLETQQIQVKEDTPVFTVLKPVTVPIEKSKPNRPLILIIWTFLGGFLGVSIVFGRTFVIAAKKKWNE